MEAERKLAESGAPRTPELLWALGHRDEARTTLSDLESSYQQGARGLIIVDIFHGHAAMGQWDEAFLWLQRIFEDATDDPFEWRRSPNRLNLWFWIPRLYANDLAPIRARPDFALIEDRIENIRQAQIRRFAPLN